MTMLNNFALMGLVECRQFDRREQQQRTQFAGRHNGRGQSPAPHQRVRPVLGRQGMAECPLRSLTEPGKLTTNLIHLS